jgi:hypothetical protein
MRIPKLNVSIFVEILLDLSTSGARIRTSPVARTGFMRLIRPQQNGNQNRQDDNNEKGKGLTQVAAAESPDIELE